jgi:hypothetical protein
MNRKDRDRSKVYVIPHVLQTLPDPATISQLALLLTVVSAAPLVYRIESIVLNYLPPFENIFSASAES